MRGRRWRSIVPGELVAGSRGLVPVNNYIPTYVSRLSSVGRTHAEEARMTQACLNYSDEDHFGAVAFEAVEAGHGVERMARAAV